MAKTAKTFRLLLILVLLWDSVARSTESESIGKVDASDATSTSEVSDATSVEKMDSLSEITRPSEDGTFRADDPLDEIVKTKDEEEVKAPQDLSDVIEDVHVEAPSSDSFIDGGPAKDGDAPSDEPHSGSHGLLQPEKSVSDNQTSTGQPVAKKGSVPEMEDDQVSRRKNEDASLPRPDVMTSKENPPTPTTPSTPPSTPEELSPTPDLLDFKEWKKKVLEDEGNLAENPSEGVVETVESETPSVEPGNGAKEGKMMGSANKVIKTAINRGNNYASPDCGAKVISFPPEVTHAPKVLSSNLDDYMQIPCNAPKKWFIVELCEAIHVLQVELANFELFSSRPRLISLNISDRYPTRDWTHVGVFEAKDEKLVQTLAVDNEEIFAKYVKVEILNHYGSEHFCPVSLFKVYGTSIVEVYERGETGQQPEHEALEESESDVHGSSDIKTIVRGVIGKLVDGLVGDDVNKIQAEDVSKADQSKDARVDSAMTISVSKSSKNSSKVSESRINADDSNATVSVSKDDDLKTRLKDSILDEITVTVPVSLSSSGAETIVETISSASSPETNVPPSLSISPNDDQLSRSTSSSAPYPSEASVSVTEGPTDDPDESAPASVSLSGNDSSSDSSKDVGQNVENYRPIVTLVEHRKKQDTVSNDFSLRPIVVANSQCSPLHITENVCRNSSKYSNSLCRYVELMSPSHAYPTSIENSRQPSPPFGGVNEREISHDPTSEKVGEDSKIDNSKIYEPKVTESKFIDTAADNVSSLSVNTDVSVGRNDSDSASQLNSGSSHSTLPTSSFTTENLAASSSFVTKSISVAISTNASSDASLDVHSAAGSSVSSDTSSAVSPASSAASSTSPDSTTDSSSSLLLSSSFEDGVTSDDAGDDGLTPSVSVDFNFSFTASDPLPPGYTRSVLLDDLARVDSRSLVDVTSIRPSSSFQSRFAAFSSLGPLVPIPRPSFEIVVAPPITSSSQPLTPQSIVPSQVLNRFRRVVPRPRSHMGSTDLDGVQVFDPSAEKQNREIGSGDRGAGSAATKEHQWHSLESKMRGASIVAPKPENESKTPLKPGKPPIEVQAIVYGTEAIGKGKASSGNGFVVNGDDGAGSSPTSASARATNPPVQNSKLEQPSPAALGLGTQKESVFININKRLKNLESNMSLSTRYLEELSFRYRKSSDDLKKIFSHQVNLLNATARKSQEENVRQEQTIISNGDRLTELSERMDEMASEIILLRQQVTNRQATIVFLEIVLTVIVLFYFGSWFCSTSDARRNDRSHRLETHGGTAVYQVAKTPRKPISDEKIASRGNENDVVLPPVIALPPVEKEVAGKSVAAPGAQGKRRRARRKLGNSMRATQKAKEFQLPGSSSGANSICSDVEDHVRNMGDPLPSKGCSGYSVDFNRNFSSPDLRSFGCQSNAASPLGHCASCILHAPGVGSGVDSGVIPDVQSNSACLRTSPEINEDAIDIYIPYSRSHRRSLSSQLHSYSTRPPRPPRPPSPHPLFHTSLPLHPLSSLPPLSLSSEPSTPIHFSTMPKSSAVADHGRSSIAAEGAGNPHNLRSLQEPSSRFESTFPPLASLPFPSNDADSIDSYSSLPHFSSWEQRVSCHPPASGPRNLVGDAVKVSSPQGRLSLASTSASIKEGSRGTRTNDSKASGHDISHSLRNSEIGGPYFLDSSHALGVGQSNGNLGRNTGLTEAAMNERSKKRSNGLPARQQNTNGCPMGAPPPGGDGWIPVSSREKKRRKKKRERAEPSDVADSSNLAEKLNAIFRF